MIWKRLIYRGVDYGCRYNISTNGIILNIETNKELKINNNVTTITINGTSMQISLKFAIAESFNIPNPYHKKYVVFKDHNNKNLTVDNLVWSDHPSCTDEEYLLNRRKQLVKNVSARRKRVKEKAVEYLGGKCSICEYDRCIAALEFHHKDPSKKDFTISQYGATKSWENIKHELDKCICVCANCHREIHNGIIILNKTAS